MYIYNGISYCKKFLKKIKINYLTLTTLILDETSVSKTIPLIDCNNASALISHEASAGKVDENQVFYLMSRGIPREKAMSLLVN